MAIDFSQFLATLQKISLDPEAWNYLQEIQKNLNQDFRPRRGGYFSHETLQSIVNMAANKLSENLQDQPKPITFKTLREQWTAVVVDYHSHNDWGFVSQTQKPEKILSENQKTVREMLPYFGILIATAFVVKTAFFYYGMHSASQPSTENTVLTAVTIALFFGLLFYFALRKK
ncbi:MAG: hypothetical protein ACXVCY_08570 [Pseudobdellovibrionaceae bacterium]